MHAANKAPGEFVYNATDRLRHDLKTPLTTISARAQLLGRYVRNTPALSDGERAKMLAGVAAIERAVREMVTAIDGLGNAGNNGGGSPG